MVVVEDIMEYPHVEPYSQKIILVKLVSSVNSCRCYCDFIYKIVYEEQNEEDTN